MSNNFPGALNTGSSLVNSRNTGDSIPVSDHNDLANAQIAVETKVGSGASVPTNIGDVLTVTGAGQTGYASPGAYTLPDATSTVKGGIRLAGDLGGTATSPTLAAVGTAGTYGSATAVPVITTDSKGRVVGVSTATITGGGGSSTSTFFNVKSYGAVGDGSVNDAPAIQAAINAAFASPRSIGTVYFPAGKYRIDSTLVCSSATSSASGYGVLLLGEGVNATQITKNSSFGPAVTFNGNGGPAANPSQFGGMQNITLNGNVKTGGLLQTNSAQQMTFRNCSFIGSADRAWDLQCMQDSYFSQCTFNNIGSTSDYAIEIYGNSYGTSNMLWFEQMRVETFYKGAVRITRGSGATGGGNNGFFFSQCKFENYPQVAGDFCYFDSYTQQVVMDQIFMSGGLYASGYSTPFNGIVWGDGSTSTAGANQATFTNIFMNTGPTSNIGNSVIKLNGGNVMDGTITINNVYATAGLASSIVNVNGMNNADLQINGLSGNANKMSGDGTAHSLWSGSGTLSAGTATISTSRIVAGSRIILTRTSLGANAGILAITGTSSGSATVTSSNASDTGTFTWEIVS